MLLYHLLWTLALPVCLPAAWLSGSERFRGRFGLPVPSRSRGDRPIWVHALSVGEVFSALPLVESLRNECARRPVVFTVATAKGMAAAGKFLSTHVDGLFYMPVDAWWCVRRILKYMNPGVFVLIESDIWPGLLHFMGGAGIKRLLVNGRVSPRTFRAYRRFPFAARRLFSGLDLCLMQSDLDLRRVMALGVDPARLEVGGNIKFDRKVEPFGREERMKWLDLFGFGPADPVVVAGSTHPGEEEILIEAFSFLRNEAPDARLIIAPRNIDRAEEIEIMARGMNLASVRRSSAPAAGAPDVIVVDTIGELGRLYGLGTVGFVGGSLVPVGGHNPLEPAGFGCPVLFGPHMHNFDAMADMLVAAGAGLRVAGRTDLRDSLVSLVTDPLSRNDMGSRGLRFVESNRGAVACAVRKVKAMLACGEPEARGC